jgi:hypothetical protein
MDKERYGLLKGYTALKPEGAQMIAWAENLKPCASAEQFVQEAIWVILCSGISYKAARTMESCWYGRGVCAHPLKLKAIKQWTERGELWWQNYQNIETDEARLGFLRTLPFMGGQALVYQLGKNLGMTGLCKPDRHLVRIATQYSMKPQEMCEKLAEETGDTVAVVDTVIWFAAKEGWA